MYKTLSSATEPQSCVLRAQVMFGIPRHLLKLCLPFSVVVAMCQMSFKRAFSKFGLIRSVAIKRNKKPYVFLGCFKDMLNDLKMKA